MFGSLKDKLKGWLSKNKEEPEVAVPTKKKKAKDKPEKKKEKKSPITKTEKKAKKGVGKKDAEKRAKKSSPKKTEKKKPVKEEIKEEVVSLEENSEEEKFPKNTSKSGGRFWNGSWFSAKKPKKVEEEVEEEIISEEVEEETQEKKPKKKGFFSLLNREFTQEKFDEMFEELELILLQSNVALEAIDAIRASLEKDLVGEHAKGIDLTTSLREAIEKLLIEPEDFIAEIKEGLKEKRPYVIVFSGINGSGKTTTIAKVAHYLMKHKLTVCLAAADTFRAAALEQIQQHADKLGVHLIKKDYGSDPASVGFDAVAYAKKHNIDVVLIDTAGRMQNRDSLMREMEKIVRVNKPDKKIFLGESITGNDATQQAKAFHETISLDGIILSKADVDEKGGTAISVSYVTGKPILFLGTGQAYDDLEAFDKQKLIEKLGLT